ncbi:MAG: hypothetical protein RL660_2861 [Bacteroidota bacterium]|jgi:hypothetical protein
MASSCTYHKHLAQDKQLLWQNRVVLRDKSLSTDYDLITQLNAAVLQKPNSVIYDLDLESFNIGYRMPRSKIAVYNLFYRNITKDSSEHTFIKRNVAEKPVAYDTNSVVQSRNIMKIVLANNGHWYAKVRDSVVHDKRKASVYYIVEPGPSYTIERVNYVCDDPIIKAIIDSVWRDRKVLVNTKLKNVDIGEERDRIAALLINKGYYKFRQVAIRPEVDTLDRTQLQYLDNPFLAFANSEDSNAQKKTYKASVTFYISDSVNKQNVLKKHYINSVRVRMLDGKTGALKILDNTEVLDGLSFEFDKRNIDHNIIAHNIYVRPGQLFDPNKLDATLSRLTSFSVFRSVTANVTDATNRDDAVDIVYTIILMDRIFTQVELNLSQAQSYDLGAGLNYQFRDNNFMKKGNQLTITPQGGLQYIVLHPDSVEKRGITNRLSLFQYEYGITTDLTIPRFLLIDKLLPRSSYYYPKTKIQFVVRDQQINDTTAYGQGSVTGNYIYEWKQNKFITWQAIPLQLVQLFSRNIDSIRDVQLKLSLQSYFIASQGVRFVYKNKTDKFQYNYTQVKLSYENSGALISPLLPGRLIAKYNYLEAGIIHNINSPKVSWVNRLDSRLGLPYGNTKTMPFIMQHAAGGTQSLRGWRTFRVGPGSTLRQSADSVFFNVGDIKLEANSELRFDMLKLFSGFIQVEGAAFVDVGNIWKYSDPNPRAEFRTDKLYQDLAVNGGFGARLDFSFFVIRVDYGVQMKKPYVDANNGWTIQNAAPFNRDWRKGNTATQISIGYPF